MKRKRLRGDCLIHGQSPLSRYFRYFIHILLPFFIKQINICWKRLIYFCQNLTPIAHKTNLFRINTTRCIGYIITRTIYAILLIIIPYFLPRLIAWNQFFFREEKFKIIISVHKYSYFRKTFNKKNLVTWTSYTFYFFN